MSVQHRLIVALAAIALMAAGNSMADIPQLERDALIALYNNTGGPSWNNNTNWLGAPGTECTWNGVTCDASETHVEVVSLDSNNLVGTLPVELQVLTELRTLWLSWNQIGGAIPPQLGNLAQLEMLVIAGNLLAGSLPPELGNLSNLWYLDFFSNGLTGTIPPELGNLTNLEDLRLSDNQLTGVIPSELGNLSNLQGLYLNVNQLVGGIPAELGNLLNLSNLFLGGNQLTGVIPPELGNLTNLEDLRLCGNQLEGPIPPEIGSLHNLWGLNLYDNRLTGSIPPELGNLSSLGDLALWGNQLTGHIPPELANASTLVWLALSSNQLTGSIPTELASLPNLLALNLMDNQLTGGVPPEFGSTPMLEDLMLSHNHLTGVIPPELGNNPALDWISLSNNGLTGRVPPELGGLTGLYGLYLDGNHLTGPIPPELGGMSSLSELNLAWNRLSGPIPAEIGNLSNLGWLQLNDNKLTGSIPPEIGNLSLLWDLNLSWNGLEGPIPPEIGNITSLQNLQLNSNKISGEIPTQITNLTLLMGGWNTIDWNAVHTTDPGVASFMDTSFGSGWRDSQTVPPDNLATNFTTGISAGLTWTPIPYQWDQGGYEILVANHIGGPYLPHTRTLGKQIWSWPLFDLDPTTTYYVKLCTVTDPHQNNQNTVVSELTVPLTVITTADPSTWYAATTGVPGNDCATPGTPCPTVREAILRAAPGEQVIVAPGSYPELLNIDRIIKITGDGAATTILDGSGGGAVVWVDWGMHARMSDLSIRNGTMWFGGGVYVSPESVFEFADGILADNYANSQGGGVFTDYQAGTRLERVELINNTAGDRGGAAGSSWNTHVLITDSTVFGNRAPWGGGLYLGGNSTIERTTVDGNTAEHFGGGGVVNEGMMLIADSSITNNSAAHGGGVANLIGGHLDVGNSTISGNIGGGLFNDQWAVTHLESCTVVDNHAPFTEHSGLMNWNQLFLHNTIVAGNTPFNCANPITSEGYNLEDDSTCGLDAPGDLSNTDPMLEPLDDNGGPTLTHAFSLGSPAMDAADPADFPATDQRGWGRPVDGNADGSRLPDIGSVEYAGVIFADGFESGDVSSWSSSLP